MDQPTEPDDQPAEPIDQPTELDDQPGLMTSPPSLMTSPPSLMSSQPNLSHDGLNPAHVPYWRVNNPTLWDFCVSMIGRADIEVQQNDLSPKHNIPPRRADRVSSICPEPSLYRRHVQDLIPLRQTCSPADAMTHVYFGKSYPDSSPEIGAPTSILEELLG